MITFFISVDAASSSLTHLLVISATRPIKKARPGELLASTEALDRAADPISIEIDYERKYNKMS